MFTDVSCCVIVSYIVCYFAGASLIWSNVILLLFKFKNCGPLPATDGACGPKRPPELEEMYEKLKVVDGDHVMV